MQIMHGYAAFTDTGDTISEYNLVTVADLDRPVIFLTPFFPKIIFGARTLYDEIVLFSYGIESRTEAYIKKLARRVSIYAECTSGSHLKGFFLRKGDDTWIIHTTANMTTGCIEGCYNVYFRKKIDFDIWAELMNFYGRYYSDRNDTSMSIIKDEDSYFLCGRNIVPFVLSNSLDVVVSTNYVAMSFVRMFSAHIKRVYFSKRTDMTKVWESGEWTVPAIEHGVTNHIKMYRGKGFCAFGSANASSQSRANAETLYITDNKTIIDILIKYEKLLANIPD